MLCVALCLPIAYVGRWDQWLGVWTETQKHIGTAFIFAMPVAAAVGAFLGATAARNGMDSMRHAAGRSQLQVQARAVLEPAALTAAGYVVGGLPALIATAVTAEYGTPRLAPFVAQIACVAAVTAMGQFLGARLPWFLGAPLSAAATYVALGFLSFNADSILLALTPIDERRMTFEPVLLWVLLVQSVFWLAIAGHVLFRRAGLRTSAVVCLFAASLTAAPLLYFTPDTRGVDLAATRQECQPIADVDPTSQPSTSRTPGSRAGAAASSSIGDLGDFAASATLCLPRGKEVVRDQLADELNVATDLLAGLVPTEATYLDDEAAGISTAVDRDLEQTAAQQQDEGRAVVPLSRAGDISAYTHLDTDQVHYGLIAYFAPPAADATSPSPEGSSDSERAANSPDPDDLRPLATPTDVLWRWYLTEVGAPLDASGQFGGPLLADQFLNFDEREADLTFLTDLDDQERARWLTKHAADIRAGTLKWSAFEAPL